MRDQSDAATDRVLMIELADWIREKRRQGYTTHQIEDSLVASAENVETWRNMFTEKTIEELKARD